MKELKQIIRDNCQESPELLKKVDMLTKGDLLEVKNKLIEVII